MHRVDPFKAEQFKKEALESAKRLVSYIHNWNKYSGVQNARQLNVQLARFIKGHRLP